MMKRILIAALLAVTPAFAAEKPALKSEDAVKAVFAQFFDCIGRKDLKCIGELCTDDVTFVSGRGEAKVVRGKAAALKGFEELLSHSASKEELKINYTLQNVRLIGEDHALGDSTTAGQPTDAASSKDPEQVWFNTVLMVLRNGKWLFEDVRTYVVNPKTQPCVQVGSTPAANPAPALPPLPAAAGSPAAPPRPAAGQPPAAAQPPAAPQMPITPKP